MKIVMIGAGNVATHLTLALQQKEQTILQVYSRTEVSASALAELADCAYTCNVQDINADADLYIVSVKDSVLSDLLPQIGPHQSQCLVCSHSRQCPYGYLEGTYTSIRSIIPDADIQQTTSCRFR